MDENSKKLTKDGYKDDDVKDAADSQELDIQECKSYRMLAARLNFIAQDNPAIQYSAKEIWRNMARPETAHFAKIKKLARFLLGVKTVEWEYPWQEEQQAVKVYVLSDSDWAGCLRTRRSTSGGLMMVGWHPLRTWSSTQKVVATSSAEAELCSAAEGGSRGLGLQSVLREMGVDASLELSTDSSSAKAFSFLDHVYLECTQRQCEISKDIVDNYRTMFESRISAVRTEKLPFPQNLRISSWSYDMEGHAKKCGERYCELANKTTQQLYKVSTPCIDDHHFKEEELKSVGQLSQVCSQILF